jgi:nitrite reductase/ring-hydroxylating ferredoxin subunit/uncharacterized membrane protein
MNAQPGLASRIEQAEALDRIAGPIKAAVSRVVHPEAIRNALSGTHLGHPLHPVLKDIPIGAWSMSMLLDIFGGVGRRSAADLLVGVGVVAAVPTAAAGLNDWSDTTGRDTRVGLVHATANVTAVSFYLASYLARRRGSRGRGKALSVLGFAAMNFGGFLGGHLSFARGVNVNRTAFETRPESWTPVLAFDDIGDGESRAVDAGAPVLLYRESGRVVALGATCSHLGGPLSEGKIADGCVTCPWHGSVFRLDDGSIVRGPAYAPQPSYDVRVRDGQIEVRTRE